MGLLDAILGGMMGGRSGGPVGGSMGGMMGGSNMQAQSPLLQMVLQMLQQNGGLEGILGKFQQAGFGQQAQSWIGTGQNEPIDPNVLQQIFGQGQLGKIAQQLGISTEQASSGVAQMLPQVVDEMTPSGQIPANHGDLVNEALAILQKGRGASVLSQKFAR
jgi:uncharacterized protein YidB (DUF937 family)